MARRIVATSHYFVWEDDWMVGDHQKEYDCYEDGGPETCELCVLYSAAGDVLAGLGCVDDATEEYRREIEQRLLVQAGLAYPAPAGP